MPAAPAAARAFARDTARMAFAPRRGLVGVPSRSHMARSSEAWSNASRPSNTGAMVSLTCWTAASRPSRRSGFRRLEARPLRVPPSMPPRELPHDQSDRQQASPRPQRSGSPGIEDFAGPYRTDRRHGPSCKRGRYYEGGFVPSHGSVFSLQSSVLSQKEEVISHQSSAREESHQSSVFSQKSRD